MLIRLKSLPADTRGIYTVKGVPGRMPARALWLHPEAVERLREASLALGGALIFSDLYRTAEVSLAAMQSKRGVQPPGYSGHNYGISFDMDVETMLAETGLSYPQLCEKLESFRWFPYRRDHTLGHESWHCNWVPERYGTLLRTARWAAVAEGVIQILYGAAFRLNAMEVQTALKALRLYSGSVDGILGPISRTAITAFQRTWGLAADGDPGPKTQRTLAFVAAEYVRT